MIKYNILWFDDDFEPIEQTETDEENAKRKTFQSDVINACKTFHFKVTGVSNYEDFCNRLHEISRYQAVVFDLRGLEKNGEASDIVMLEALRELYEAATLPVYIYSADIEDDHFELLISPMNQQGRCFNKKDSIAPLFRRMKKDLDDHLHVYEEYPECLELFNEGFLDMGNKSNMNSILTGYYKMDSDFLPYNCMRHILEDLFNKLMKLGIIPENYRTLNQRVDYVTRFYHYKKDRSHELDFDNPKVPYAICPREVKRVMNYLADITNHNSHFFESSTSYLRADESIREYKLLLLKSVYPAFIYVMKWYYGFMLKHISLTP